MAGTEGLIQAEADAVPVVQESGLRRASRSSAPDGTQPLKPASTRGGGWFQPKPPEEVTVEYLFTWRPGLAFLGLVVAFDSICIGAIPALHYAAKFDNLQGGKGWYRLEAAGAILCATAGLAIAVMLFVIPQRSVESPDVGRNYIRVRIPTVLRLFSPAIRCSAALCMLGAIIRIIAQGKIEHSAWGASGDGKMGTTTVDGVMRMRDISLFILHFLIAGSLAIGALYQSWDQSLHPGSPRGSPRGGGGP
eukprot:TRINITY_DN12674_c0_g1_i5.p1 TRINITY_DN12674_c0_g1~~TRINITY_DN12674_c0_g1_i5.p1  ORF type:complete len:282 (+),score=58.21 TRINITY_DN12674_c0_g1_i5:101-847(+)